MYLLVKIGSHMLYGNEDINTYINSDRNTLEKAQYWEIFIAGNTDLQLQSSGHEWQKNEKKEEKKKNTGNCKVICVLRKRKNPKSKMIIIFYLWKLFCVKAAAMHGELF